MRGRGTRRAYGRLPENMLAGIAALGLILGTLPSDTGGSPLKRALAPDVDDCAFFATGGSVSVITVSGFPYCLHEFTNVGTSTFTVNRSAELTVDYLIVAGGGGGSSSGGGAGGVIMGTVGAVGSTQVVVGAGGSGISGGATPRPDANNPFRNSGGSGGNSSAFGLVALGGGGGGGTDWAGVPGGSGGGAASTNCNTFATNPSNGGAGLQPSSASGGLGNPGGKIDGHCNPPHPNGGGGGAGSPGEDSQSATLAGRGGDGVASSITGVERYYAGGGGGGFWMSPGVGAPGGIGGGGSGVTSSSGTPNTGGGGGGGRSNASGGDGGSGVVLLRYALVTALEVAGTPTVTLGGAATAGSQPGISVAANDARLRWASSGTSKIEVRLDPLGPQLPAGVKLFVQLGSGTPVEVLPGGGWVTVLPETTNTSGDESLTYSVTFDPMSALVAAPPVTVGLEFRIGA
jgi:hypothetical protein